MKIIKESQMRKGDIFRFVGQETIYIAKGVESDAMGFWLKFREYRTKTGVWCTEFKKDRMIEKIK